MADANKLKNHILRLQETQKLQKEVDLLGDPVYTK